MKEKLRLIVFLAQGVGTHKSFGEIRSGYIAVTAKRGQLSLNLEGLQPGPDLKWRKNKKKGA